MVRLKKLMYNLILYLKMLWYSLFYGMESANKMIFEQNGYLNDNGIFKNLSRGGVMNDLIEQKVTKEVEELREKNYRILKEADLYDTSSINMKFDSNGEPIFSNTDKLKKKTYADFMKHPPVYTDGITPIRVIQDNKMQSKGALYMPSGIYDYCTTLVITRDKYIPRFEIEKFATKVVVRQLKDSGTAFIDLYLPTMASQFGKIDAILISNLYKMFNEKNYKSDFTEFKTISWISDKAWNSEDMCMFKYKDIKLISINIFDGNFVLTFEGNIVFDGKSIVDKYMTEELDEKYANNKPKGNAVNIFSAKRNVDKVKEKAKINYLKNKAIKIE